MYIHLPGRHYDVNLIHPQAFLSEQSLQVCPYFVFSGLFLDDMQLLCSTSPGCLYRLHLHRLFPLYQQGFFLPTGLFRKIWVLSSPEFQVASAVSSELKFLDARNLTCLQPLPNGLYTNQSSLNHRSFRSVWTQKQNKSRCILGAFIVPLILDKKFAENLLAVDIKGINHHQYQQYTILKNKGCIKLGGRNNFLMDP